MFKTPENRKAILILSYLCILCVHEHDFTQPFPEQNGASFPQTSVKPRLHVAMFLAQTCSDHISALIVSIVWPEPGAVSATHKYMLSSTTRGYNSGQCLVVVALKSSLLVMSFVRHSYRRGLSVVQCYTRVTITYNKQMLKIILTLWLHSGMLNICWVNTLSESQPLTRHGFPFQTVSFICII